jgi:phospholipid-binding lipoprotein MlaA
MNPLTWVFPFGANAGRTVALGLDERERNTEALEEIRGNSLDPYARLRSLWRQNRDAELGRATVEAPEVLEDPEAVGGGGG